MTRIPSNGHRTGYSTYANGWRAVIANARRTRRREDRERIAAFYEGQNARGWSARFYDDEAWTALALLDAYSLTHQARYTKRAEALVADIETGWDSSCCGSAPGGIWWNRAHTQKATASNAGPVIAACELYQDPKDRLPAIRRAGLPLLVERDGRSGDLPGRRPHQPGRHPALVEVQLQRRADARRGRRALSRHRRPRLPHRRAEGRPVYGPPRGGGHPGAARSSSTAPASAAGGIAPSSKGQPTTR